MKQTARLAVATALTVAAGLSLSAPGANAARAGSATRERPHPVFVQTDESSGNRIVVFDRGRMR